MEGKKFKLLDLPSTTSSLLSVLLRTVSAQEFAVFRSGPDPKYNPTGEGQRMPPFLGGKPGGAVGQPSFFLAGNRMTTVAFEKEVFLKA